MPDWSSVEFAPKGRKSWGARAVLPLAADLMVLWDFVLCAASGLTALSFYAAYVLGRPLDGSASGPFWRDIVFGSLIAALMLRDRKAASRAGAGSVLKFVAMAEARCVLAFVVLIAVGFATRATNDLARLWLCAWLGIFAALLAVSRAIYGSCLNRLGRHGGLRESVAIIGTADMCRRVAARMSDEVRVAQTFCPDDGDADFTGDGEDEDDLEAIFELGREGEVDSVVLAVDPANPMDLSAIIERLKALPIQVAVCAEAQWSARAAPQLRLLGGLPMTVVADQPIQRWSLLAKTLLDKIGATLMLLLLAPLLLAIAIVVGLTSSGPIIFRQKRSGWCGRQFTVFKFRTMHAEPEGCPVLRQTCRDDSRCTRIGRVLRRYSLDELPQLWNVVRGDMSLVGPRPHADNLHDFARAGQQLVSNYAQRHRVKPGITGWAQIHGARGATATVEEMRERVELDLFYIEHWSLWLDTQILLRTPFVMTGENAF